MTDAALSRSDRKGPLEDRRAWRTQRLFGCISLVSAGFPAGRAGFVRDVPRAGVRACQPSPLPNLAMRLTLIAVLISAPALSQVPHEDTGFSEVTPAIDQDLVVVRERAFAAGGIDLSPYGIPGVHDFVQSIYVRAYHGTQSANHVTRGRIVLPSGVTVLGLVTDPARLGGSIDDGVLTASDLDFAIGGDPDRYSAPRRGTENRANAEHIVARPNDTVEF